MSTTSKEAEHPELVEKAVCSESIRSVHAELDGQEPQLRRRHAHGNGDLTEDEAERIIQAEHEFTPAEFKRLRWKIDLYVGLPVVSTTRFLPVCRACTH